MAGDRRASPPPRRGRRCAGLSVVIPIVLSGCASDSRATLATEVEAIVHPGLATAAATARLQRAGFACGASYDARLPDALLCSRTRSYYIAATCIQRVFLIVDGSGAVGSVRVETPACAGL